MGGTHNINQAYERIDPTLEVMMTDEMNESGPNTVILDLGRKKRKQVKKLRKGKGKLMARIHETIEELKEDEILDASSQVVVVVVREKKRGMNWNMF